MYKVTFFLLIMVYACLGQVSFKKSSVFVPTEHWQEIGPDQSIPRGLHVRINMTTGKKEAKLLDDGNSSDSKNQQLAIVEEQDTEDNEDDGSSVMDNMEEFVKALKNIKNDYNPEEYDEDSVKKKFRSIAELKEELAELNLEFDQGPYMVSNFIDEFEQATENLERISILNDFEDMLHELDAATDFTKLEGTSKVIVPGLNSTSVKVKSATMSVIGAAAQSNPSVQIDFMEKKVLFLLLNILANEEDVATQTNCVYAISNLVRGFPFGQKKLIEIGGLDILLEIFLNPNREGLPLQLKVITLIRNLLEEKINAIGQRADQLRLVDIDRHLMEGGWCEFIPSLLQLSIHGNGQDGWRCDYDTAQPIVDVMNYMASRCKRDFQPYTKNLFELAKFLWADSTDDDDGELYEAVVMLIKQIRPREDL